MSDSQTNSRALPGTIIRFWFLMGGLLVGVGIVHAILMSPAIIGVTLFAEQFVGYIVFAAIGWMVLHTVDTLNIIRFNELENIKKLMDSFDNRRLFLYLLIAIHINSVLLLATGVGYLVGVLTGMKYLGITAAILYANLDTRIGFEYPTPGKWTLKVVLTIFHGLGVLKDVSVESVLEDYLSPVPPTQQADPML
ncbi:hypothetical protein VB779_15670 [Haloarculaceae archaeon H-GB11]|nr:hypothetical protein [Haloarculaceae archaeon H-GB1-1]MEA5388332.1 hypothetical protein [Haloarculaceae archaeon H-GB11]